MSTFVFDCPVCSAKKSTFDVNGFNPKPIIPFFVFWNVLGTCRSCKNSTQITLRLSKNKISDFTSIYSRSGNIKTAAQDQIIKLLNSENDLNIFFEEFYYSPVLPNSEQLPEHLPSNIEEIFNEAAKCLAIGCFNAAGAMFRLCLDVVTKHILEVNRSLNPTNADNKSIHSRLKWIFENRILPANLEALSKNIKDDGNDAAHDGSIKKEEAEDLLDFTYILLEQVYTIPKQVEIATQRRVERRQSN